MIQLYTIYTSILSHIGFLCALLLLLATSAIAFNIITTGLLPTKAAYLMDLGTVLELLYPKHMPLLIMGYLNACNAALAPTMEGQVSCVSADTVLNKCNRDLLSLPMQQALLVLSGTIQLY